MRERPFGVPFEDTEGAFPLVGHYVAVLHSQVTKYGVEHFPPHLVGTLGEADTSGGGGACTCLYQRRRARRAVRELVEPKFQSTTLAERSHEDSYKTMNLAGLFVRERGLYMAEANKGRFYHDGRFETLLDVVNNYNERFDLGLTDQEKADVVEYLKSLQEYGSVTSA